MVNCFKILEELGEYGSLTSRIASKRSWYKTEFLRQQGWLCSKTSLTPIQKYFLPGPGTEYVEFFFWDMPLDPSAAFQRSAKTNLLGSILYH